MILKNITKKTLISVDIKLASSFSDRLFGLLKKDNPRSLIFNTRFGIHSFFLKQTIDVLILDKKNTLVLKRQLKPNNILIYPPQYRVVIELPEGSIKNSKTEIGDKIKLIK